MTTATERREPGMALDPDRNLALELVRATEAAAINCSRYLGFGDKNQVDAAAVDAMRPVLGAVRMNGVVVIGEGEKDEAPMLYNGERVGDGSGPEWDIAVDPVDGTTLTAKSLPDAVSVLGVSPRGTMFNPGPAVYMRKLVVPGCGGLGGRAGRADRRHPEQDREAHRPAAERADRGHSRPSAARRSGQPDPRRGFPDPVPAGRRRGRGDHGRHPRHRGRPAGRHGRHSGGSAGRVCAALPRRGDVRPAGRARRGGADRDPGRRFRSGRPPDHHRPGGRGQRVLRRHRGHRRGAAARRAVREVTGSSPTRCPCGPTPARSGSSRAGTIRTAPA